MGWLILWPLALGFALSGVVQALVRREKITALMSDDSPRSIAVATGLGAASSSCSYAAVALARALFRKGANFTATMAFEIASTNLVIELGLILAIVMGWQFTLAEFVGGPIMIIGVAFGFRLWMRRKIVEAAREQADKGLAGSMEGHAGMDMSVQGEGTFWQRLFSREGVTAVGNFFVMDWAAVWKDIVGGLLLAGAFSAWVPKDWLQSVFFSGHPLASAIWGPIIGPLLAMVSFVCSVGNVPLAAVLWNGGISFGGVVSFIFADLIIIPIILIYRKYYGWKAAIRITLVFYGAMVLAGYIVEIIFRPLGLVPTDRHVAALGASITWNYTTWLNIVFLLISALLIVRFLQAGGINMLKMMGGAPDAPMDHKGHNMPEGKMNHDGHNMPEGKMNHDE